VGSLGSIVFTVSDRMVRTIENWKLSGSARYATHNRHMGNALTEFVGLDPDKITFDMQFLSDMGVNPAREIEKLWEYERRGLPVPLTVGSRCFGRYRWNVVSHSVTVQYTDRRGNIAGAAVSVSLVEYLRTSQVQVMGKPWNFKL